MTAADILAMKGQQKIVALTAYDATFARIEDEAGIDLMLVGDSLGMVIQGNETTIQVTIEDTIYHCKACAKAVKRALLVADMPFMSYQVSHEQALTNAGRCLKEGYVGAVKLEGGENIADTIRRIVDVGIPVMGHVGMQPQRVRAYGGYAIQGKKQDQFDQIVRDAVAVQEAGAFSIVLEKIPRSLAKKITAELDIPTVGIAAGPDCDGQILVNYDLLGLADQYRFRFARRYRELAQEIRDAVQEYGNDIRSGNFPTADESFN